MAQIGFSLVGLNLSKAFSKRTSIWILRFDLCQSFRSDGASKLRPFV